MISKRQLTIAMICIIVGFVGENLCFGQSYWKRTYGSGADLISAIQSTDDGNFLMVGYTGSTDGLVVKIKPNGDTIWTKIYGGEATEFFSSIQPTSDGNFLIAGFKAPFGCVVKIKSNGDTIWTKTYDGYYFYSLKPTSDGNFLVTGSKDDYGCVLKIKPNGDTIWTKTCNKSLSYVLQPTSGGNFLIAGDLNYSAGWLVMSKPNGDTIWTKIFNEGPIFMIQPTGDNFLIACSTHSFSFSFDWLAEINLNGDTIWTKSPDALLGGMCYAIQPTSDGNILLAGNQDGRGWLAKTNMNGGTIWTKTIDGFDYGFNKIQTTNDGNFLLGGVGNISIACIIADQYAYKNTPFTYKIPTYSIDTLNFAYVPLKVPTGMTVSAGGTISWTPRTDSVYMDHAEFLVLNDIGRKDTLTFNVFVNSDYHTPILARPSQKGKLASTPFDFTATSVPGHVKFLLPSTSVSLCIYDITGRIVDKITPVSSTSASCFIWPVDNSGSSKIQAGKYLVRATTGNNSVVKTFALER